MKRSPLTRKTALVRKQKATRPKRLAWIKERPRLDLSRMDSCPEAIARAAALMAMGCACCGSRLVEVHLVERRSGNGTSWSCWGA